MLLAPWAIGCGVARRLDGDEVLLLAALLAAFLAHNQVLRHVRLRLVREPDRAALASCRRWAMGLGVLAALAALPLVLLRHRPALIAFGALSAALAVTSVRLVETRRDRGAAGQMLAAVALPLSAPVAHYVARGELDRVSVALWLVSVLYFLGAVLYVRLKIEALTMRAAAWSAARRLRLASLTIVADLGILATAATALHASGLSTLAVLAFAPTAVHTVVGVAWLHRPVRLKRLGLLAAAHSAVFAGLMTWLA